MSCQQIHCKCNVRLGTVCKEYECSDETEIGIFWS
jgi:hypothetical protein